MAKFFRSLWSKIVTTFSYDNDSGAEEDKGPSAFYQRLSAEYAKEYDADEKGNSVYTFSYFSS